MKVTITGGAGFIGHRTAARLLDRGHEVTVLDNLVNSTRASVPEEAEFVHKDIRDDHGWDILDGHDAVIHLAAIVDAHQYDDEPFWMQSNNATGTLRVLDACRQHDIDNLVFSSTCAVYGDNGVDVNHEDSPTEPNGIYASTKLASEQYIKDYANRYGIEATRLRYANIYGEGKRNVVSIFKERAEQDKDLIVHGDGTQERDFVHVHDVVRANEWALDKGADVYNIGTGTSMSIRELAEMMVPDERIEYDRSHSGHPVAPPSVQKADRDGYSAQTRLEDGLLLL